MHENLLCDPKCKEEMDGKVPTRLGVFFPAAVDDGEEEGGVGHTAKIDRVVVVQPVVRWPLWLAGVNSLAAV